MNVQIPRVNQRLDRSNPLSRGAIFATFPQKGVLRDIVAGSRGETFGTVSWTPTNAGIVPSTNITSGLVYEEIDERWDSITTQLTIAVWFETITLENYANCFCVPWRQHASGWSFPWSAISLEKDGSANRWDFVFGMAGNFGRSTVGPTTTMTGDNFWVLTRNGSDIRFYKNGVYLGANASSNVSGSESHYFGTRTRPTLGMEHHIFKDVAAAGRYKFSGVWNRAMSPDEVASLTANPWQLIERPKQFRFWQIAAPPEFYEGSGSLSYSFSVADADGTPLEVATGTADASYSFSVGDADGTPAETTSGTGSLAISFDLDGSGETLEVVEGTGDTTYSFSLDADGTPAESTSGTGVIGYSFTLSEPTGEALEVVEGTGSLLLNFSASAAEGDEGDTVEGTEGTGSLLLNFILTAEGKKNVFAVLQSDLTITAEIVDPFKLEWSTPEPRRTIHILYEHRILTV